MRIGIDVRLYCSPNPATQSIGAHEHASGTGVTMTALVYESKTRCLENQKLLTDSRFLMIRSGCLLNRAWEISGVSDSVNLRATVRERLARGWLFPAPHKVWAGKGTGHVCVVCETTIAPSEIEHEVVEPARVWAHLPCYSIWRQESDALIQAPPPGHKETNPASH
jgi:hypothetical protein